MTSADSLSDSRRRAIAMAILVLAFALRAWRLHAVGFTADEVSELQSARKSIVSMLLDEDDDLFPPLYRPTAAMWNRLWGTELATRWLNVAYGVAATWFVWLAAVELLGDRRAVWPALLFATAPFHVHYCREGRAYALYVLFAAIAFWAALAVWRRGEPRHWIALTVASAAAVWTHYFAGPLVVVVWAWLAVATLRTSDWKPFVAAAGVLAILLAPTPLVLRRAMADHPDEHLTASFDKETYAYAYLVQSTGYTLGPSMLELRSIDAREGARQMLPWAIVIGLAWAVLVASGVTLLAGEASLWLLLTTFFVLVPLLGFGGNLVGVGFFYRYAAWLPIPYALLLGAGASRNPRPWIVACATATLLLVHGVAYYNRLFDARYAEEDFRAVAARLDELASPDDPVIVASPYMAAALNYYRPADRAAASFPIFSQAAERRERDIAAFLAGVQPGQRYWIVSQWLPRTDVRRETRDATLRDLGARFRAELNQTEIYEATRE